MTTFCFSSDDCSDSSFSSSEMIELFIESVSFFDLDFELATKSLSMLIELS